MSNQYASPPAPPPVYRQDAFVRQPTSWTRPMQTAVAAYFALGALMSLLVLLPIGGSLTERMTRVLVSSGRVPASDVSKFVGVTVTFTVVGVVIGSLLDLLLAAGSFLRRWTWLYIVDMVFLALGALGLLRVIGNLAQPDHASVAAALIYPQLLLSLAGLALFTWMLVAIIRFGPWACAKAPALLEG